MSMFKIVNISTLPPELLETVFKDVVQNTVVEERALTALTLTHVCRSFRRVGMDCPQLWTCLCRRLGRPGLALIEACIERSRNRPLEIVLYLYSTEDAVPVVTSPLEFMVADNMICTVLPHSARWLTCSLQLLDQKPCALEYASRSTFQSWSGNIDAPMLNKLSITTHNFSKPGPQEFYARFIPMIRSGLLWNVPNLKSFVSQNTSVFAIPPTFRPQLQSLAVRYSQLLLRCDFYALQELSMATSITTFRLTSINCRFGRSSNPSIIEFPSVKFLHIELLSCTQYGSHNHVLWSEFSAFYFPNAVQLHINVDVGDMANCLMIWNGYNTSLYSLLARNLVHEHRYPSLETLDVAILPRRKLLGPHNGGDRPTQTFLLPLHCVPSLQHLRMRSTFRWKLLDSVGEYEPSQPPYFEREGDAVPIALKTLAFNLPRVDGVVSWVKQLTSKMRNQQCWDQFSELTVVQNDEVFVIPRDGVERWCEVNQGPSGNCEPVHSVPLSSCHFC